MADLPIFPLSNEHKMLRDAARDFAQKRSCQLLQNLMKAASSPAPRLKKWASLDSWGSRWPEQYGGSGMDALAFMLALEEICKVDAAHGVIMSVNNSLYCHGILKFGTEEQKKNLLHPSQQARLLADIA